jgi:LPS export ABC transporter protein LptC
VKRKYPKAAKGSRAAKFFRTAAAAPHILLLALLLFLGCSFDYGNTPVEDTNQPDIVMENVEYVRVRSADPVVRFQARRAERYEKRQFMELQDFSFEQFESHGEDVNASGRAGTASVELDSGNIRLGDGVSIAVDSEDITIETEMLSWQDKERLLTGEEEGAVNILQGNGASFTGWGFSANVRRRTWEFSGGVEGTYIHEDEEDLAEDESADGEAADSEGTEGDAGR